MMLFCKQELRKMMDQIGVRGRIYTSMKALETSSAIEYGAILFLKETVSRSTKSRRLKAEDLNVRRFRVFDRTLRYMVSFGSASAAHTEAMYEAFMRNLPKGILDPQGNYIPIEITEVDWMEKEDSILRSELLVQMQIIFETGLYKDNNILKVQDIHQEHEIIKEG